MRRALAVLLLALALVLAVPAPSSPGEVKRVAVLFDIGGRGDLSFNDMAWYGAQLAKKELEGKGYKVEVVYYTPRSTAEYVPTLEQFASSGMYEVLVCVGFLWTDALKQVAQEYPEQKFGIIDAVVDLPNVISVVYRENEGSALVGALAAAVSRTGKIGIVLGMEIPVLWKFEIGYGFGAKWMAERLGKNVTVYYYYTGTFSDPGKGREAAKAMIALGADVIYAAAGATGLGVLDEVYDTAVATNRTMFAIGVDADQDWIHPGYVITSMRKKVDLGVKIIIEKAVLGEFKGGILSLGLKEGGVGMTTPEDMKIWAEFLKLPKEEGGRGMSEEEVNEIVAKVTEMFETYVKPYMPLIEELKEKIISGEVYPPVPTADTLPDLRAKYMTPLGG